MLVWAALLRFVDYEAELLVLFIRPDAQEVAASTPKLTETHARPVSGSRQISMAKVCVALQSVVPS